MNEEAPHREEVRFEDRGTTLAGHLSVPALVRRHPAVVLVRGAGPSERDEGSSFLNHFVRRGIAVLSYDRPGVGGSSGDWRLQTVPYDRAQEALAAVRFLRESADVDAEHVGLWGISQGGWVVPLAASISEDIAFIITVSGPGVNPAEQNLYDIQMRLRADGFGNEHVRAAVAYVAAVAEAARTKWSYEELYDTVLRDAEGQAWYEYSPVPDAGLWEVALHTDQDYDPEPVLERVNCPVLAIFGERDVAVPVTKSIEVYNRALTRGGNHDFTVKVFRGADHGIKVDGEFALGYLELMSEWILERASAG
ncbi:MAG: alpha/beta fold hydrolase [Chloroflexota bacterium]|nr:alpha/beta fold hydrolase [Chloroflexota bacterium]